MEAVKLLAFKLFVLAIFFMFVCLTIKGDSTPSNRPEPFKSKSKEKNIKAG